MLPLIRPRRYICHLKQVCCSSHKKLVFSFSTIPTNHNDSQQATKPTPPPIEVVVTPSAGRGVFATRNIESGELIHTAKPIISHPILSSIHNVCYLCLKNKMGFDSQMISFCSQKCSQQAQGFYNVEKQADWSAFDDYCRTQGLKYPLLVKRLACMVISGVASADSIDILQPGHLSSEMILLMEREYDLLKRAFEDADMASEKITFLTKQWYMGVLARIRINAFRIELAGGSYEDLHSLAAASVEAESSVGNSVYILPSFYNHDCDPNAHILWIENVDARLKALRDIETGEELRICYIDSSMDFDARQNILSKGFGFECRCLRCLSKD